MTNPLKQKLIDILPGEKELDTYNEELMRDLGFESDLEAVGYETGYNQYRQELIDSGLDKLILVVREEIKETRGVVDEFSGGGGVLVQQ